MEIFIDSSDLKEIEEIMKWGIISGATTNPKILTNDKCSKVEFKKRIIKIIDIIKGPVSVEVTSDDFDEMVKQAVDFSKWHRNIVVKIPMGINGLKAVKELSPMIKTNVTACMSSNQCILAAMSGATYTSIFFGRIGDMGYDPTQVIRDTTRIFRENHFRTKIIIGSIRTVKDVLDSMLAGGDIITITPDILRKLPINPMTKETIDQFNELWKKL